MSGTKKDNVTKQQAFNMQSERIEIGFRERLC